MSSRTLQPPLPERGPSCPPAALLEAATAGEALEPRLSAHLPGCASCQGYVASLRAAQEEFLKQRPAELFLRQVSRRAAEKPKRRFMPLLAFGLPASALAAAVLLVVARPPDTVRFKGGTFKVVYKRAEMAEPREVTPDLRLRAGDALRFSYVSPGDGHLLILDLDSSAKVSAFYPFGATQSEPIKAGPPSFLPGSVVLDATPGPEWIVAVFSPNPLEVDSLARQLEGHRPGTPVELECDCKVEAIRIEKEP